MTALDPQKAVLGSPVNSPSNPDGPRGTGELTGSVVFGRIQGAEYRMPTHGPILGVAAKQCT